MNIIEPTLTIDKELGIKIGTNIKENKNNLETLGNYKQILATYLIEFRKLTQYWMQAIRQGLKDKSIKIQGNVDEIAQFIFILINGIVQIMDYNYLLHEKDALNENNVENMTLKKVERYLEDFRK